MTHRKLNAGVVSLALIAGLLTGCAAPAAAPTPVPPAPTPEPPTATPIPPEPTLVSSQPTAVPAVEQVEPKSTPAASDRGSLEPGEITSQALTGNLLGDLNTRTFVVQLPPGYESSDKRYPVVYALHGYGGDAWGMVGEMRGTMDRTVASGDVREMILVYPDASNKLGGSCYLSSPTIGDYEAYITQELVAHIDANYRTIPHRDARGITGCSMGGDGAMHLALTCPEVFSVVAGVSGMYDEEQDPNWETARDGFTFTGAPSDFAEFAALPWQVQNMIAAAAAAAPNPEQPPFYLDMPFEVVGGEAQIVPDVFDKVSLADPVHDARDYLNQPARLRGIMIYHGTYDQYCPVEVARAFDEMLTELGVAHEYLEVAATHCTLDYKPVLQFMADHLAFEMPQESAEGVSD